MKAFGYSPTLHIEIDRCAIYDCTNSALTFVLSVKGWMSTINQSKLLYMAQVNINIVYLRLTCLYLKQVKKMLV